MPALSKTLMRAASILAFVPAVSLLLTASAAGAWGSTGHRIIGRLGIETLPADIPAFLRSKTVVDQVGELAREPDRSRLSGQPHDEDLDPGHFIDIDDAGHALNGPAIDAMPANRDAFSAVLHAAGGDLHKTGWLYYNLIDGEEQLAHDFAIWRVDRVGEKRGATAEERAWYAGDRKLREALVVRDLGYWAHFVGDATQPMHASVHYNGWGDYPNPNHYTQDKIHLPFEGAYIHDNVTEANVRAALPAPAPCVQPMAVCMARYLKASNAQVGPLYALWTGGGFKPGDARGKAFAVAQLAAGAAELRELVVRAWGESRDQVISFTGVKAGQIEDGAPLPFGLMYGDD